MQIGQFFNNIRFHRLPAVCILLLSAFWALAAFDFSRGPTAKFEEIKNGYRPSDIWILDRHGLALESIRTNATARSLDWVEWSQVSPVFQSLLVQTEDRRFFEHRGVDWWAVAKSGYDRVRSGSRRGASTITMQLVGVILESRQLPGESPKLGRRRGFFQKWRQAQASLELETHWSKQQILEGYINLVPFRGELKGLRAASRGYFAKDPIGLNAEESSILISLLRSPNSKPSQVAKRACRTLALKSCESLEIKVNALLSRPYQIARRRDVVPVINRGFIEGSERRSVIQTSLDSRVQSIAMRTLQQQLRDLMKNNVNDAAVLVLENKTGRVVAYVANGGRSLSSGAQIDGVQMKRQAGSTLKPFVYAVAIDQNILAENSLLNDSPIDFTIAGGAVYRPRNYDNLFRGHVSAGEALGSSLNVPAVRALTLVGVPSVHERLQQLGFTDLQDVDHYGPSLALGTLDVSLWDLTHAYRRLISSDSPFSSRTRESIFAMLALPEYRRYTFGLDSALNLPFHAAVKTGTSKDMRDNWCVGYTSEYTVGVWVGNFNGEPMWNVSGLTGAAPIWRRLMLGLHPQAPVGPSLRYRPPESPLTESRLSRIRYPAGEMLVGFDPDIPSVRQKLPIEIEHPQAGDQLFVNGKAMGPAQDVLLWKVVRGRHRVELRSADGTIRDHVQFEVR